MAQRLDRAGMTDATVRNYTRQLFGGADDQVPDRQGRIVIKPALRQYAGLTHECAVIGVNSRVEVWDAQAWREFSDAREQDFVDLSVDLIPPGTAPG